MLNMLKKFSILIATILISISSNSQSSFKPIFKLNDDGSNYIKLGMTSQIWLRYTEMNPGSGLYGSKSDNLFDISLRRTRFVLDGKLTDNTYFFVQFGQNNFNLNSAKYTGAFFHDVVGEYHFNKKLHLGAGLTGLTGLLRNASPSIGSIMTLDAPLYQQATNGVNDQFLRKLSFYAKGSLNKFNYRLAISNPMAIQNAKAPIGVLNQYSSSFSPFTPKLQLQGYINYQLFDDESITTPYTKGTYLGAKKVLSIGTGIIQQQDAMWILNTNRDTTFNQMLLTGIDVFFESKIDSTHNYSITAYGAYSNYNFGKNYIRNVGVNNPVNTTSSLNGLNGPGNNFPMIGSGNTVYVQVGYLRNVDNEMNSKIQPYLASQVSDFEYLDELMIMFESGVNWYIRGKHTEKITLNYQNRPFFIQNPNGENIVDSRKSMAQIQLQLGF